MLSKDQITDLAENKVLLLYILNKVGSGIIEDNLFELVAEINDTNFFIFKDLLIDLMHSGLVSTLKDDNQVPAYILTTQGKNSLELTEDILPGLVKLKADTILNEKFTNIVNESSVLAEFIPTNENEYTVILKIIENNKKIFELRTFAGSRERAKKIVDNWKKNSTTIYPKILDILYNS